MMFKLTGSVLIIMAAVFLLNQKTIELYFTLKFLSAVSELLHKILYENNSNLTYRDLFVKLNFNADKFITDNKCNRYIDKTELDRVLLFMNNLGKRDKEAEIKYLEHNLSYFENKRNILQKKYAETQKVHLLYGLTVGIFISIILI